MSVVVDGVMARVLMIVLLTSLRVPSQRDSRVSHSTNHFENIRSKLAEITNSSVSVLRHKGSQAHFTGN